MKIWVDPNGGANFDKIQVSCEFRSKIAWTCIYPSKYEFARQRWVNGPLSKHRWFADIQKEAYNGESSEDFEFSYDATRSQLNSLALISNKVRQEIIVNCNNTVAYYDADTQSYDKAVLLTAFDEKIVSAGGKKKKKGTRRYQVDETEDGCSTRSGVAKTKIEINTASMSMLPILDIGIRDAGEGNQEFGFELGPVCFGTR